MTWKKKVKKLSIQMLIMKLFYIYIKIIFIETKIENTQYVA